MDRLRQFGFLLKDLSKRYVLRFEARAKALSLTLVQCKALATLERNQGVSQARLAELTDVDPMAMVRMLDHMEAEGLVQRRPDPDDRRARQLFLTDAARPLLEQIWRVADATRAETFAGIGRAERDAFMDVLEKLHANALAFDSADVAGAAPAEPRSGAARGRRTVHS